MDDTVRWSLKVSRETDEALRIHLGRTGGRKGDLSKFVQQAVQAKLRDAGSPPANAARGKRAHARAGLARALEQIRARTSALPQARFEKIVAEAVAYARKRR